MVNLKSLSSVSITALLICIGCGSSDTTSNGNATSAGGQVSGGGAGATGSSAGSSGAGASAGGSSAGGSGVGGASAGSAGTTGGGGTGGANSGGGGAGGANSGGAGGQAGPGGNAGGGGAGGAGSMVSFFVSSATSMTGNLGGLDAADALCDSLATAAGFGGKTWHAYLSVENGPNNQPVNAGERIGQGPWYNSAGVLLANNLTELHAMNGDYELFLDENGDPINGQWDGSPGPNEHDILTGTNRDGTVATGLTCEDWTSESDAIAAQVGHCDGLGPNGSMDPMYQPWNTTHTSESCADTAPRGGAGRIYCFAID